MVPSARGVLSPVFRSVTLPDDINSTHSLSSRRLYHLRESVDISSARREWHMSTAGRPDFTGQQGQELTRAARVGESSWSLPLPNIPTSGTLKPGVNRTDPIVHDWTVLRVMSKVLQASLSKEQATEQQIRPYLRLMPPSSRNILSLTLFILFVVTFLKARRRIVVLLVRN